MPDYWIVAKRKNPIGTHIAAVKIAVPGGTPYQVTKAEAVALLEIPKTISTLLWKNGEWKEGAKVHLYVLGSAKYIRTDPDKTPADNLESLPDF